ncbi:hypothetical protein GEMRC1_013564 [Eukaryota sp. GEM-RC1]
MLWLDKHRPTRLSDLDYHLELTDQLETLGTQKNLPHLLFYGPSGAGKKTRVLCLLREVFGASVSSLHVDSKTFKFGGSSTSVDVPIVSSNHHIELTPSEQGKHDRHIIQEVIKEIAGSRSLDSRGKGFKVVVLNEVDHLSKSAQHALRRTMEKYMASCRLVLIATSIGKVLEPVRSRCLCIRVPAPTVAEISSVMKSVAKAQRQQINADVIDSLANVCDRNLRRGLLALELSHCTGSIAQPDWVLYIEQVAGKIIADPSPRGVLAVRKMLYELLVRCVPCNVVFSCLTRLLLHQVPFHLKSTVLYSAAQFQHNSVRGSKDIYHLEAFVVSVMSSLKQHEFSS